MSTTTVILEQPRETGHLAEIAADGKSFGWIDHDDWNAGRRDRPTYWLGSGDVDLNELAPPIGSLVEFWGQGLGHVVRGVRVYGTVLWYRTEAEQEALWREQVAEGERRRQEELERNRDSLDRRYEALPETFRARIDKFRRANPNFRRDHEGYELFCCEEALVVARWSALSDLAGPSATSAENLAALFAADAVERNRLLTGVVSDSHSGNTFDVALRLAHWWVNEPGMVEREHGALVALVGCAEYGCPHEADPA